MASGSFAVTTSNQYVSGVVQWSSVANNDGNYSDVTATLKLSRTNTGYTTSGNGTFYVVINGTSKATSKYYKITYNSNTVMATGTVRVPHNDDGTKSITISAYGSIPGVNTMSTQSGTAVLDTIPRGSTVSVSPTAITVDGTSSVTSTITPEIDGVTHSITYSIGTQSQTFSLAADVLTHTFTVPASWANQIHGSVTGSLVVSLTTYFDGSQFGVANTQTVTAQVPTYSVSISADISDVNGLNGLYVQSKSSAAFDITATSFYGATVEVVSAVVDGITYSGSEFTTNILNNSGSVQYTITATDSRGVVGTFTGTISVQAYSPPYLTTVSAVRADVNGDESPLGTYALVTIVGGISSVNGNNAPTYTITVGSRVITLPITTPTINTTYLVDSISTDQTYVIKIAAADNYMSVSKTVTIAVSAVPIDIRASNNGIAFGKVAETDGLLESDYIGKFNKTLGVGKVPDSAIPNGSIDITGNYYVNGQPLSLGADYVVETGTDGNWYYEKWNSGISKAWYNENFGSVALTTNSASGVYTNSNYSNKAVVFPAGVFIDMPFFTNSNVRSSGYTQSQISTANDTVVYFRIWSSYSTTVSSVIVSIECMGHWK